MTVEGPPGFARRGAILDPYVLPDVGVTDASRALLLERVRFGVQFKLELPRPRRTPWPEIVRYCDEHSIELMNTMGYQHRLVGWSPDEDRRRIDEVINAGTRSIALCFDDISTTNPEALASQHATVVRDLYAYVRGRDPGIRVSTVLPPYGGIPGRNLVFSKPGEGERYLAVMRDKLPADIPVFWTGMVGLLGDRDGGGRDGSPTPSDGSSGSGTTTRSASTTAQAVQRPRGGSRPSSTPTWAISWRGPLAPDNGEFALLTSLAYTWNPTPTSLRGRRGRRGGPLGKSATTG